MINSAVGIKLLEKIDRISEPLHDGGILFVVRSGFDMTESVVFANSLVDENNKEHFGICFYHEQDVEHCLSRGELYLTYAVANHVLDLPVDHNKLLSLVGCYIIHALRAEGFYAIWEGCDIKHRIRVGLKQG